VDQLEKVMALKVQKEGDWMKRLVAVENLDIVF
jgi:hypothetical protein